MNRDTTWRKELKIARAEANDDSEIVAYAPDEVLFDEKFYAGFGGSNGPHVLAWSKNRVYFPVTYDGAEWMESAPRRPIKKGQRHVGGE